MTRLRGISRVLDASGYRLVLFDVERPEQAPADFHELAGGGRVDAVLAVTLCPDEDARERFAAAGITLVLIDRHHPLVPSVTIDDVSGGRLATEHLLALGHERIGFVGDIEPTPALPIARRHAGYAAALRAAREDGVGVPGDLSLLGFDDVEVARWAGLTTVAEPLEESGAEGAELVLAALSGKESTPRELQLSLVARLTTDRPGTPPTRPVAARGSSYA